MKNPIELLKKTEATLFQLQPKEALKLKAYTIQLLRNLPVVEYQQLVHQIAQHRKSQENFLSWLKINCPCSECQDYEN